MLKHAMRVLRSNLFEKKVLKIKEDNTPVIIRKYGFGHDCGNGHDDVGTGITQLLYSQISTQPMRYP